MYSPVSSLQYILPVRPPEPVVAVSVDDENGLLVLAFVVVAGRSRVTSRV